MPKKPTLIATGPRIEGQGFAHGTGGFETILIDSKPHPRELIGAAPKMLTELRRLLKRHGEQETANVIATATKRRDRSQP